VRGLPPGAVGEVLLQDADLMQLFFNWYLAGYLHTGQSMGSRG